MEVESSLRKQANFSQRILSELIEETGYETRQTSKGRCIVSDLMLSCTIT